MILGKGTVVGKYRLESPLAQGGMGAVWMARHVRLGTPVAVKFLAPALVGSRRSLARFEREAHAATVIQSPHVIQVHDFGVEDETPYLVMELLHGENLAARLQRHKRLSLVETARILIQVGKALRRAHAAGIVHRDIKPGNLFLAYDDDEEIVKILDFGIAKTTDTPVPEQTEPGTMLGSPNYMSPEQAAGDRTVDHRSDLWSMAVVLYQTVTGELPFQGHTMGNVLKKVFIEAPPRVTEIAPDLPAELDVFFRKALAKKRHERYQSIDEMVVAFVAVAAPEQAVPPSSMRHPSHAEPQPCDAPQEPVCSERAPATHDTGAPPPPPGAPSREVCTVPTVRLGRHGEAPPTEDGSDPAELLERCASVEERHSDPGPWRNSDPGPAPAALSEDTPPPRSVRSYSSPPPSVRSYSSPPPSVRSYSSPPPSVRSHSPPSSVRSYSSPPPVRTYPPPPSIRSYSSPPAVLSVPPGALLSALMSDATPSGVTRSEPHGASPDGPSPNSVTLRGRPVARRRLASMVPWLVVAAMLAVPLFYALFRSPTAAVPDHGAAAMMANDPRTAAGGAPRMDAPGQAPSAALPEASNVAHAGSGGFGGDGGSDAGAEPESGPDQALASGSARATRPEAGDASRPLGTPAEALSEGDVYDDPPARGRFGKGTASAAAATGGPPAKQDVRPAPPGAGPPENRWF